MLIANTKKRVLLSFATVVLQLIGLPAKLFRKKVDLNSLQPKKILLVRLDHIGDLIMSSPAFTILRDRFPESKICLLANNGATQLFTSDNRINEIFVFNWPWSFQKENNGFTIAKLKELFQLIKRLRRERFDLFIDFRGDLRFVFLFGVLTGIKIRLSNSRSGKSNFLNHISEYDLNKHEVERSIDVIKCIAPVQSQIRTAITLNEQYAVEIKQHIEKEIKGVFPDNIAVIAPYSSQDIKSWPTEHFRNVIAYLHTKGFTILIAGTSEDSEHANEMIKGLGENIISLAGKTSLQQLAALLALSKLVVGIDTGVLHLASCFNVPIIAIFGPTRSFEYRPYSPYTTVIESLTCKCDQLLHLECNCQIFGYTGCMYDVHPNLIQQAIDKVV